MQVHGSIPGVLTSVVTLALLAGADLPGRVGRIAWEYETGG